MQSLASTVFEELRAPLADGEAVVEADRCLECGGPYAEAPCVVACPAGRGRAGVRRRDRATATARPLRETIFAENLLGGTCARVCPVEVLCEGACVLAHEGRPPIEIGAAPALRDRLGARRRASRCARAAAPPTGCRVAVIGAGPAGLACAGELAARGYTVTVYDERDEPGGLVRYAIAPYRQLERAAARRRRAPLARARASRFELGARDRHAATRCGSSRTTHDAVVLAVGHRAPTPTSPYPGDELPGVWELAALHRGDQDRPSARASASASS